MAIMKKTSKIRKIETEEFTSVFFSKMNWVCKRQLLTSWYRKEFYTWQKSHNYWCRFSRKWSGMASGQCWGTSWFIWNAPCQKTPAHQTENFAELVCSNSLRGNSLTNAVGVLKEEMRRLNSIIIGSADQTAVPAGGALAVDRDSFLETITEKIKSHPLITIKMKRSPIFRKGL